MPRRHPPPKASTPPGWNTEAWCEERRARYEAVEEAVSTIEDQGYFMDRQTEQLCQDFIAGRFTPDEIVSALLKPRLH